MMLKKNVLFVVVAIAVMAIAAPLAVAGGWTAYNDCCYRNDHAANAPNVTIYDIGNGHPNAVAGRYEFVSIE